MKKIALLTMAAVLGSFSSARASSPSPCPPDGACAGCTSCDTKCADAESAAIAQERAMAAELTRLVTRYVSDASVRAELLLTLKSDSARAPEMVELANVCFALGRYLEAFSATDRACYQRVVEQFKC